MAATVKVDISDVGKALRVVRSNHRTILPAMLKVVRFAAKYEQDTHPYTNRTGMLEASTNGWVDAFGDPVVAVLSMGMHYASYVNNLGYSNIDEAGNVAANAIGRNLELLARDNAAGVRRVR